MKRFRNEKGRMLSLLLSLVLTVGLIYANAVPASAAQGNTYSFAHAYDCQRAPAYPKKGDTFQASGFLTPLDAAGHHIGGDINANYAWMLTSLGNYGGVASPSTYLTSIVNHIAAMYGVEAANVEVFQLTKDGSYIATGVIFARSSELTAFLGDNWNENGSTYLLSSSTLTDPTTVTISQDVTTGFAPSHTHSWASVTSGNGEQHDTNNLKILVIDNAGTLKVRWKRPRRNTVKVLMLMDSGGSMSYYSQLCSMLFQAARQSNHFKELHVYYFHNCVYSRVYTDPRMYREHGVSTEWLLKNFGSEYKVIFVGDALMDMYELTEKRYDYFAGSGSLSGMDWLKRFKEQYDHLIWLNPEEPPRYGGYWGQSYGHIARLIDMYPLSVDGLERGMKKLLVSK